MLGNRARYPNDGDRDNFERSLTASINKAINLTECAVKEKHARIVIIASHKERSGSSYWHIVRKLPLQENPLVAWKFCHVTHKLLRDGHSNVLKDSLHSSSFISDLGKLWGHLREGYGVIISSYTQLLHQKLIFHRKNPQIHGNLVLDDDDLDKICANDINSYFELSVDMLDYMDCILQLQKLVFNSMDMSRSNSMTSSGQCRLAPLIPCMQDSCQLYHFLVQILFKLHSNLPADTLSGHRERFYKQFNILKQFYTNARNLQYFKNLIQVPDMPNSSPNFLRACELSSHIKPMALVSEPEDYGNEADNEDNIVCDLVDTMSSHKPDRNELLAIQSLLSEKNTYIGKLENELKELKQEIERIRKEDQMVLESLHNQIEELESEIVVQKQIAESTTQEIEVLKSHMKDKGEDQSSISEEKFNSIEKLAKVNEDKFIKMKDVYGKLREEHVQLLRTNLDVSKRVASARKENETLDGKYQNTLSKLEECKRERSQAEEELKKFRSASEEFSSTVLLNKSLESDKQLLQRKLTELESELEAKKQTVEQQNKEMIETLRKLDEANKDKLEINARLLDSEKNKIEMKKMLDEAILNQSAANENIHKFTDEQQRLTSCLNSSQQKQLDVENKLALLNKKFNELTEQQQALYSKNIALQENLNVKTNELQVETQILSEHRIRLKNLNEELSMCRLELKGSHEKGYNLQLERSRSEEEKSNLKSKMNETVMQLADVESQKEEIYIALQKKILSENDVLAKLILACESMTNHSLAQLENIHFSALNCTADYLLENITPTIESLNQFDQILMSQEEKPGIEMLLTDLVSFSFCVSGTTKLAFATAHSASIEAGEDITCLGRKIGEETLKLLEVVKPDVYNKKRYIDQLRLLKGLLEQLLKQAVDLLPKIEDVQAEKMDDLLEEEMQMTTKAIEMAASRITEILASSRLHQSDIQLEVNEKILGCCNNLMMKIRILIEKSKVLQKEIVAQGRGASTTKDFYKKHHRWTEGLISAAKAVGFGANILVDSADKVVNGKGKFEELVVCAQEIAASTAQLVVASKVKAERGSDNLSGLSEASKGVSEATGLVVASARSGAERIEEHDTFDFSKLTLHQAKRKEMDSQVRVLELDSLLEKERRKLAELRKIHYQLAGEAEGWDTDQQK